MHYRVSGNSLYFFVNLILVPVPPVPTHLLLRLSLLSFWYSSFLLLKVHVLDHVTSRLSCLTVGLIKQI